MFWAKITWNQIFFGFKIFFEPNFFDPNHFYLKFISNSNKDNFSPKIFWTSIFFDHTIYWSKNSLDPIDFVDPKPFLEDPTFFLDPKSIGLKHSFLNQNIIWIQKKSDFYYFLFRISFIEFNEHSNKQTCPKYFPIKTVCEGIKK